MGLNWAVQPEYLEMNKQAHTRERTEPASDNTAENSQALDAANRVLLAFTSFLLSQPRFLWLLLGLLGLPGFPASIKTEI